MFLVFAKSILISTVNAICLFPTYRSIATVILVFFIDYNLFRQVRVFEDDHVWIEHLHIFQCLRLLYTNEHFRGQNTSTITGSCLLDSFRRHQTSIDNYLHLTKLLTEIQNTNMALHMKLLLVHFPRTALETIEKLF